MVTITSTKNKNKKRITLDGFLKIFPWLSLIALISIFILITIKSHIKIYPPNFTYKGFEYFTIYYNFPLNLFIVSLTIWGILVAYRTYIQTKEQFIIINSAWLKTEIKMELVPFKDNNKIKRLFIGYEIENTGNTPAENFNLTIDITTDKNKIDIPPPSYIPNAIYPHHPFYLKIGIGKDIDMCKEIMDAEPTFLISIKMNYITLNKIKYVVIRHV